MRNNVSVLLVAGFFVIVIGCGGPNEPVAVHDDAVREELFADYDEMVAASEAESAAEHAEQANR